MKMREMFATSAVVALAVAPAATPALADSKLYLKGKVISTGVHTINGSAYVKLSEIAKALGLIINVRPDGYELSPAGGSEQIEGIQQGKIGDTLFDGKWRFKVLSVQVVESYTMKTDGEPNDYLGVTTYDPAARVLRPTPGNKLILVQCQASNARATTETLWIARVDSHTAIADMQGESHPVIAYDISGAPIQSKPLIPSAKVDVPLLFSIPQATVLKDLVFTLRGNHSDEKANDVRVSLRTADPPSGVGKP